MDLESIDHKIMNALKYVRENGKALSFIDLEIIKDNIIESIKEE